MKWPNMNNKFLHLTVFSAAVLACSPQLANAASYPDRPIMLVVGYAAGGATDVMARLIAKEMSEQLGQAIVVENRPGANSNIGTAYVAKSKGDGYTLLVGTISNTINAALYKDLNHNFQADFAPIGLFANMPNVLVVNPHEKIYSVKDYIAHAKANPGKMTCASAGTGSSIHLSCELFKQIAGVDILHVPYKGSGPALTDLIGGQVASMFDNLPSSMSQIKAGGLRALAVTTIQTAPLLPEVQTIDTAGLKGFESYSWSGLVAPAGVPKDRISVLSNALNKALEKPALREALQMRGYILPVGTNSPQNFKTIIGAEAEKWKQVIKRANLKSD